MYWIITRDNRNGNEAVTSLYMDIIKKGCEKTGIKCEYYSPRFNLDKEDTLIFDECKIAYVYMIKGYKNIIVWIQGIVPEEAILQGYSKARYIAHSVIEKYVLKNAKLLFFVSNAMLMHYQSKYKINFRNNYLIMPCFNEKGIDNESFRNKVKYSNNTFTYIGGLNAWQCIDETLKIYKIIEEKLNYCSKFFLYTKDIDTAKVYIKRYGIKTAIIDYKDAKDLGNYIKNIKYGFVLRKNHVVNRVATPTKLSNYIAHGIIPIYSSCIESFNNYNIESNGPAVICDLDNVEEGINNIVNSCKRDIDKDQVYIWVTNTFADYYCIEKYVEMISNKLKDCNNL